MSELSKFVLICDVICRDVLFTFVGCDAAENYMLLEIHNWCKW